ncbi:MAG: tetratricopeptide repeat protein [candidate division NC10 bacterium]|nr:tetratricopeptide repeat protein [candidate division NC10 bacterium]
MANAPKAPVPRGRRIPLSQFWLDWRISFFMIGVCVLVLGAALVALTSRPRVVPSVAGSSPAVHRERAQFYEGLGRIEDAIREYEAAIRQSPADPTLHRALALLCDSEGRFAEAIAAYERFLQLEAASPEASAIRARIAELGQRR